ncbi:endonuclease [Shewanella zhangzhouensis]|uniref:endonuclease n=1 Tax=Shewanella zhangzhouensis TaxID=2864213 RepID=UPI001C661AFA|nr:endonuclease [Shewanella zhangzhouensis]QYK05832.1 endonuclease [Shewanella zhangzhouensis]
MKLIWLIVGLFCSGALAAGNTEIESFSAAKKLMQNSIYTTEALRKTIYCGATFDSQKQVTFPDGFQTAVYLKRRFKWEAEHIVPAENFGQTFSEWREGSPVCVDSKGKKFKGRKCAEKANKEYRLMQSDLYNLAPAIGSVNAARQNYNFTMLPAAKPTFGSCDMRIENDKVQPPEEARGRIARAYLYFEASYPRYKMSKSQRQLMNAWDKQYPVTKGECEIAEKVKAVQQSDNPVLDGKCAAF